MGQTITTVITFTAPRSQIRVSNGDLVHVFHFYLFSINSNKMGVNEEDVVNIMGGMENAAVKMNDSKRKLKNR